MIMRTESGSHQISIIIAVVSGPKALVRCLHSLYSQAQAHNAEIIVPCDSLDSASLRIAEDFPGVRCVQVPSVTEGSYDPGSLGHIRYDLQRATGLAHANGRLIALTEDHAVLASDWCSQLLVAHDENVEAAAIGGAIENEVDSARNWALYYCDFGRYGRPLSTSKVEFLSDVNVCYKRESILAVRELWERGYQETTVHWAMLRRGAKLFLNDKLVVFQHRPNAPLIDTLRERVEWGRAFAETRVRDLGRVRSGLLFFGSPGLPLVLWLRAVSHMMRQRQAFSRILYVSPLVFLFVVFWSVGEALAYLAGLIAVRPHLVTTASGKP